MRRFIFALLLIPLLAAQGWTASGDVLFTPGTAVIWSDTITGGVTEQLDLGDGTNGLNDAVSCGSYKDWGSGARAAFYQIDVKIDGYVGAPTAGEGFRVYIASSDATTTFAGPITLADTTDAVGTTPMIPNWIFVGSVLNINTTSTTDVVGSFRVWNLTARYWAPCIHNSNVDGDADFQTSSDAHLITVTPYYLNVAP